MAAIDQKRGSKGAWAGVVVILLLAWLFLVVGLLGVYLHRTLYNEQVFAKRITAVLQEPGVQNALATKLTDAVITEVPKAVVARPIIQSAAQTVIAEPAFTTIVTTALVKFHQLLLNPETANIVFKVEGAPQLIEQAIQPYDPTIAKEVGAAADAQLAKLPNPGPMFRLIQLGASLGPVMWVLLGIGALLLVAAALIAPSRRKGVIAGCVTFGLVGLGTAILLNAIKWGLDVQTANDLVLNEAAGGVFNGLFGDLLSIARGVLFVGVLVGLVVWSLRWTEPLVAGAAGKALDSDAAQKAGGQKLEVADVLGVAKAWGSRAVTPAQSDLGKIVQILAALAIGLLLLFKTTLVLDIIVLVVVVALLALALNRLMILIINRRSRSGDAPAAASGD